MSNTLKLLGFEIPQCAKCQCYGYTKKFCHHKAKCVKCAEDHLTANCSRKIKSEQVKYVLREGNHPANYKGCEVHKQLQKARYPTLRARVTQWRTSQKPLIGDANTNHEAFKFASYAQDAGNNTNHTQCTNQMQTNIYQQR